MKRWVLVGLSLWVSVAVAAEKVADKAAAKSAGKVSDKAAEKVAGKAAEKSEAAPASGATVDWRDQVIRATGSGAPDLRTRNPAQARLAAEKAAQLDAFRNLLAEVKGIHVTTGRRIGDTLEGDEEVRAKVEGVLRGFKVVKRRYFSDSGVELEVELPLSALSELLPTEKTAPTPQGKPAAASPPAPKAAANSASTPSMKYTGVLVDARGLTLTPALAPRLLGPDAKPLFAAEQLSVAARERGGGAAYFATLAAATGNARLGDKPLIVKAVRAEGADVVVDASAARQLAEASELLDEGRIGIVTP
ncbi:MAG: LPP20 family lipoprotein [Myxococcaceae bacterium]